MNFKPSHISFNFYRITSSLKVNHIFLYNFVYGANYWGFFAQSIISINKEGDHEPLTNAPKTQPTFSLIPQLYFIN